MPRGKGLGPSASCGAPEASLSARPRARLPQAGRPASADPHCSSCATWELVVALSTGELAGGVDGLAPRSGYDAAPQADAAAGAREVRDRAERALLRGRAKAQVGVRLSVRLRGRLRLMVMVRVRVRVRVWVRAIGLGLGSRSQLGLPVRSSAGVWWSSRQGRTGGPTPHPRRGQSRSPGQGEG